MPPRVDKQVVGGAGPVEALYGLGKDHSDLTRSSGLLWEQCHSATSMTRESTDNLSLNVIKTRSHHLPLPP